MTACATVYSYTYGRGKSDASPSRRARLGTSMRLRKFFQRRARVF